VDRGPFRPILAILLAEPSRQAIGRNPLPLADPFVHPFTRKGRGGKREPDRDQASREPGNVSTDQRKPAPPTLARAFEPPPELAPAVDHGGPKQPQQDYIGENSETMRPGQPFEVIGQESDLYQK
jgi:hypothetical protein